ncbi:MAG: phospho-N-acetylmuramoyl-pentapeptide-transferase [Candidatus Hydrogenedentes bacterium CG07_land_8_20_14_0_80_42_17]|nr:MAG: phospho-N-acetylmuramoyl-pentapeptide-transferase [Candidatus Hydrogenedentes bacterium CG07_land_8_20_14_0_80_42_17]
MFFYLAQLSHHLGPLRLFQYITVRTALATIVPLILTIYIGPYFIESLKRFRVAHLGERDELNFHAHKLGTPTMGGLLIVSMISFSILLFGNLQNRYVSLLFLVMVGLASVGFIDDYLKLTKRNPKGLSAKYKLLGQIVLSGSVAASLFILPCEAGKIWMNETVSTAYGASITIPFIKNVILHLGWLYIPFVILVIVGSSNAVNLTDGLDGLATGCMLACSVSLAGLTYVAGHYNFSSYLNVLYIRDAAEITVFLGAMIGALLGFLWFNSYPAEVFMGDTGSLSLGGALGTVAIFIKQELLLVIIGGIFVAEALSVIIQVASFKTTGKRIFKMAPLHHHFELSGWAEPKVIVRFWIISFILTMIALATLKLR